MVPRGGLGRVNGGRQGDRVGTGGEEALRLTALRLRFTFISGWTVAGAGVALLFLGFSRGARHWDFRCLRKRDDLFEYPSHFL